MGWRAKLACPHCGKVREYISYGIKMRSEVHGKRAMCFKCGKTFTIRSSCVVEDKGIYN